MASLGRGDEQCEKFDSLESQEEFLLETKLVVLSYLSLVPPHVCADSRKGESSSCTTHSDESDVSPRQQSSHPSPRVSPRISPRPSRHNAPHAVSKLVKCSTFKDSNTETHASHLDSLDLLVHNLSDNITEVDEIDAGVDTSEANGNFEKVKVYEAKSCPDLSNNKQAGNSTKLSIQSVSDEFHRRKNSTPSDDMQRLSSAAKKLHRQSSLPSSKASRKQTSSSADLLRRSSLAQSSTSGHNVCYEDGVTDSLDHASQSTDIALDDEEDESHDSMSSLEDDEKENTPDVSPIDESKKQNNHMQDSGAANSHDSQDSFLPCPRVPSRDMYLQLPGPIARPHDRESAAVLLGEEISEELHSIEEEIIRARSAGLHMNLSPVLTPMTPQTEVAMRIANIGDSVCYLYHERFEQLEEQLMGITGESLTYERFREVISSFLGEQGGGLRWVALLLDFTQHVAVHLRQKGERGVSKLVNFTAKFIADRTAAFILQNGGWAAVAHWDSGSSASNSLFSSPRSSAPVTPYQEITENPLGQLQAQQRDSHLNSAATYLDTGTEKKETEEELTNMENPIQLNDCDANGSNTLPHDKPLQDEDVPSKESSPDTEPNTSSDCACDTSDCNTQQGHWLPYLAGFLAVGLGIVFALKR